MIDSKNFVKLEVIELVQALSNEMHDKPIRDCARALAILNAFCIDAAKDQVAARETMIEATDWVLSQASLTKSNTKLHEFFRKMPK